MSRAALARSVAVLLEDEQQSAERYVDLCFSLRLYLPAGWDLIKPADSEDGRWRARAVGLPVDMGAPSFAKAVEACAWARQQAGSDDEVCRIGGRWDRRAKCWSADARKARIVRVHRGQERAARWLAEWLRRKSTGDWRGFWRVWSVLLVGGRRGGKSHLAVLAVCLFGVMTPGARVWAVSPTQEETDELEQAIKEIIPRKWYRYRGGGAGKPVMFRIAQGARIMLLSGHKPASLKRGRTDLVLYNEGQNMSKRGFTQLRGAVADRGGLVLVAANPPDTEIGRWIEEFYEKARAKKIKMELFEFSPKDNPLIEYEALADMADEEDELTFRREVLGEFTPIGDVVMHAWSDAFTVRDVPIEFIDITADFTRQHLGRPFGYIVGMDFQKTPHMAAAVFKVFCDPADEERTPLLWIVDEVVVEDADEDDLVDELEARGRWTRTGPLLDDGYRGWAAEGDDPRRPVHCCVIADASGDFQDGAHSRGKTSFATLRRRNWRWLYKPDANSERNPDVVERCKLTNARLKNANGKRRMFSCRANERVNHAMRYWERRNGIPYKRSVYGHIGDAVSYVPYRFFARPKGKGGGAGKSGYSSVRKLNRRAMMKGL